MTISEAAEKANNWAALSVLAKVGMFLAPLLLTIFLFVAGYWINAYNERMDRAETRITASEQASASLSSRLGNLETRSNVVGPQRDQFQRDTQQTLKELTAILSELRVNDSRILQRLDDLKGATP